MALVPLTTYKDLVDHLVDWLGASPTGEAQRDARRAVLAGLRTISTAHNWSYYYTRGHINTNAIYTTGTVGYTSATRTITLTGGSFPSWALYGSIQVFNIVYQIAANPDPATLILTGGSAPASDFAPGQSYTLYRDTYPLPGDCQAVSRMVLMNNAFSLWYEHPDLWLERQRVYRGPATPRTYTLRGEAHYYGVLAVSFFPPPDAVYPFDFVYKRVARALIVDGVTAGTASATLGSTTISGSGTTWTSNMVGSVFRLGTATDPPTGLVGPSPAVLEGVILAVGSPTSMTIDTSSPITLGNAKYVISDPVDVEPVSMLTPLLRACEHQLGIARSRDNVAQLAAAYRDALILAREADSRNFALECSSNRPAYPYRLAQMPRGSDVS